MSNKIFGNSKMNESLWSAKIDRKIQQFVCVTLVQCHCILKRLSLINLLNACAKSMEQHPDASRRLNKCRRNKYEPRDVAKMRSHRIIQRVHTLSRNCKCIPRAPKKNRRRLDDTRLDLSSNSRLTSSRSTLFSYFVFFSVSRWEILHDGCENKNFRN